MRKRKYGIEALAKLLCRGKYGPTKSLFVLTALGKFAKEVEQADLPNGFIIRPEIWKAVAKEVLANIEEAYPREV